jgi:polysaccharide export outer membrane protein
MRAFMALLLMSVSLVAQAQNGVSRETSAVTSPGSAGSSNIVLPDKEYVIGPTDVIEVFVLKMPEISREYRVGADGSIEVPFLGKFKASEKTSNDIAGDIAKSLKGDYLVDPQVSVIVKQVNRRYFVQGAVRIPGVYNIEGRPTLLELITIAGGLNPTYGETAFIMHNIKAAEKDAEAVYELKKANLNALLRGDLKENVIIEAGDIVQIPASDVFFVAGEVRSPGSFALKEGTTLRQAISLAQNTIATAAPGKAVIFREEGHGQKKEIPVDITAVMRGRKPDVPIMANDIIVVPNSKAKSAFVPVMNSFGVNIAYGAARVIVP